MILSYRHPGLKELFEKGTTARINKTFHGRILRRLDALNAAREPNDMDFPGFNFHSLRGKPVIYTVHVNRPWSIDFEFEGENAVTGVGFLRMAAAARTTVFPLPLTSHATPSLGAKSR